MYKDINSMIQQHLEGVAELFQEYGINAPVNQYTVASAVHKYGQEFVDDLEDIIEVDFSGFATKEERKAKREAKKTARKDKQAVKKANKSAGQGAGGGKKPFGQTAFGSWLTGSATNLLGGLVGGGGGGGASPIQGTIPQSDASGTNTKPLTDDEKDAEAQKKKNQTYMIVTGAVLTALLLLVVFLPAKTKGV